VTLRDHFARLLRHEAWAQREVARSIRAAGSPPEAVRLLAHIIGAAWLWLERLGAAEPRGLGVWPTLDLAGCEAQLGPLADALQELAGGLDDAALARRISYVNSRGESWTSSVHDVVSHLPLHSAHHRGQVASLLRAAGHAPAVTDFAHSAREGFLD
jgi:uncharacterized damage-inducible protein DinB